VSGETGWAVDTNVLSEMVSPRPAERVMKWITTVPKHLLFTTAITEAESYYGLERLPPGRRRDGLRTALDFVFSRFSGRILPFDSAAARSYARILAQCERDGKVMSHPDAQIAAILKERNATLVTRNTRDFADSGIRLFNPWID
jgi:toxin FitB